MLRFFLASARVRLAAMVAGVLALAPVLAAGAQGPGFDTQVAPLLAGRCVECHNPTTKQGGLDLTRAASVRTGGGRGPAAVPGKPDASWLWKRVAADQMPPKHPLTTAEKKILKDWIAGGATWGTDPIDPFKFSSKRRAGYDWWSLQPVKKPALPAVKRQSWAVNPIDRFVLARLEANGLQPSPPADRVALVRRLYFDLLGLPPRPEEVEAFVNNRDPHAYEYLVDRLLASPHYGERWARHWLDVVRFAETQGFERNKLRPNAWKYRDWVVEALNSDLPYDEFVRQQVAGDVLHPDDPLAVIASGMLVMGPYDLTSYTTGTAMMRAAAREEELEGLVGTVTQTFLGLTVNCARCHDHKFDPIPAREYYRIAAALAGTYHGDGRESLSEAGKVSATAERDRITKEIAGLKERGADSTAEIGRLEARSRLLAGGPAHVSLPKDPGVVHILARGDFREKREVVAPGGIAALAGFSAEWGVKQDAPEPDRRKALAAWLTDPANPLTARVMVNRIWGYHFGAGLVQTPSDFGFNGGLPSHPELLDYLAASFAAEGAKEGKRDGASPARALSSTLNPSVAPSAPRGMRWSIKQLHRLILTSNTYKQASRPTPAGMKRDADNRLLWRQNPRRLEAEAVRDSVLAVSGELNPTFGGPGYRDWKVTSQGDNEIYNLVDSVGPEFNRRSLYRTVVRAGTLPLLDVFDCPDPSVATARRTATTTPLQALSLLNNAFTERNAAKWADRLKAADPDAGKQTMLAYRQAFGRAPDEEELGISRELITRHGLSHFCLVLLNTNEFLYVD
jgi:hypothetical protein